jgi:hypothetical protein
VSTKALSVWLTLLFVTWSAVVVGDALLVSTRWSSPAVGGCHMMVSMAAMLLTVVALLVGTLSLRAARVCALALVSASIALAIGGTYASDAIRMAGFRRCGERLRPTVSAIGEYERRNGYPPIRLVDAGLPAEGPATGLGAYPSVVYERELGEGVAFGNQWMLRVEAFHGGWDQFIFLPNGNYPKVGFGGTVVRLDDWAYVYE